MIAFALEYLIVGLAVAVALLGLMLGLAWIFRASGGQDGG